MIFCTGGKIGRQNQPQTFAHHFNSLLIDIFKDLHILNIPMCMYASRPNVHAGRGNAQVDNYGFFPL